MSTRPIATALLVANLACSEPAAAPPDWTVRVLPVDERVYKIPGEIGFEDWHIALVLTGPEVDAGADELSLDYRSGGRTVATGRLDRQALQAFLTTGDVEGVLGFRNLHQQMPAALEIDSVRIRASLRNRVRADRTVPLVRYQQKNRYRLPVSGCWFVSSGHDFGLEHRRWYSRSHFAWDLVRVDESGDPHPSGDALTDYRSFGQPVLAPADGRVVLAVDGYPDNPPGRVGERQEANFIVIDHGGGEHSKLAHLARGSLQVARGDRVRAGQALAGVGNSGLSDAPHLHLHFQGLVTANGRVVAEPPLPVQLSGYWVTSNAGARIWTDSGRPRRGEYVCAE